MLKISSFFTIPQPRFHGDDGVSIDQIQSFIDTNKDKPEVKSFIEKLNPISEDRIKGYFETDEEGKKISSKLFDQRVTESVKKFEANFKKDKLPVLIEEEYKKKHPDESPEQTANRELNEKVLRLENENRKSKQKELALELINEAKLPFTKIIDKFIGEDDEDTASRIQAFKNIWEDSVSEAVKKAVADQSGRSPDGSNTPPSVDTLEKQYEQAKKAGNMLEMVKIKNLIHAENLKKA